MLATMVAVVAVVVLAQDTFPSNLGSARFSFGPAAYLEPDDPVIRAAPRVSFGD